jgi:DNA-binding MarR family transcriptional regulator
MVGAPLAPDEYAVYSVLFDLGPKTPTELARVVGMPPTTMSHYVRAMLGRGHANRKRALTDGRSYMLTLSDAGLAAHRESSRAFELANRRFRDELQMNEEALEGALTEIARAAATAAESAARRARAA